jgi:hypothetical protein
VSLAPAVTALSKQRLLSKWQKPFYFFIGIYQERNMWKLVVGFIIFAALALYMLSRGGDIDLSGEKHGWMTAPDAINPHGAEQKIG